MLEIDPNKTKQIIFTDDEFWQLKSEIQAAFCKIDTEYKGETYSLKKMRGLYPKLAELFMGS